MNARIIGLWRNINRQRKGTHPVVGLVYLSAHALGILSDWIGSFEVIWMLLRQKFGGKSDIYNIC